MKNYKQSDKRSIRVFISSTFRDMIEDRNALMTHCWPELRRFCRERQVELVEVDLRWGIAEEQSTRKETLKLCLDEIHACRPFFVGLLGERYGWVPGDDAFTADLKEEQPWLQDINGKSVTELEILHGVLNNPEMAGHAFFYFRNPDYVKGKGADFISETSDSADKQRELKKLIRKTCSAKKIPLQETYSDPKSLAALVLKHLKAAINIQFPFEDVPDTFTREALDHEAFAESRRLTYIGRPDYFVALNNHCSGNGKSLVLLGDSGSGKSALLANWIEIWRTAHPNDFIFQHYIGGTPDGAIHWKLMTRLMAEIKQWTDDPDELPRTNDDILRDFPLWLSKARIRAEHKGVRFIVVLDALNQLEDKDHGRILGWLPEHPFTGALRLIVSTLTGDTSEVIEKRVWPNLHIQPLETDERRRMIVDYLARFSKKLDIQRLDRLSAEPAAANPLYLKILLDELRVTGTHDKLDERLNDYLASNDIPALLGKVLVRYQHDYEVDRKGLVSEALGLIWVARRGLTENELLELLKPTNLSQLPLAIWTPLRSAIEEMLIDRGGIINFTHDFMRNAIETAYLSSIDKKDEYRNLLTNYFETLPPTLRICDELPWLLWQSRQLSCLRSCLLKIDYFLLIYQLDKIELSRYWIELNEERKMGIDYLDSFKKWMNINRSDQLKISKASNILAMFLRDATYFSETETLYNISLQINIVRFGNNHPETIMICNNLADLYLITNRKVQAESELRKNLEISEAYFGKKNPIVGTILNNLSRLLHETNRPNEAIPLIEKALEISKEDKGSNHPEIAIYLNNLAGLYQAIDRYNEADSLFQQALSIDELNYGSDHIAVAKDLNNLVINRLNTSYKHEECVKMMKRALLIEETYNGLWHPRVAFCLHNLALLLERNKQQQDALPFMRRHLEILLRHSSENSYHHPNLRKAVSHCGRLLSRNGINIEDVYNELSQIIQNYGQNIQDFSFALNEFTAETDAALKNIFDQIKKNPEQATIIICHLKETQNAIYEYILDIFGIDIKR